MKKRCSPRKKYSNGTGSQGINTSNYIPDPSEVMNDYNIMLAKTELEASTDSLLPIVTAIGGILTQSLPAIQGAAAPKATPPATAAFGNSGVQADIEMEGGEIIETPTGQIQELQGPSHEQGGIPMKVGEDVPQGTVVYSDRLSLAGKTLAERKAIREKKLANINKSISGTQVDLALRNSAQRQIEGIEKEDAGDLSFQEKINTMQSLADNMIKAFGTGPEGVQKLATGTGPLGVLNKNITGYNVDGSPIYAESSTIADDPAYKGISSTALTNPNLDIEAMKAFTIGEGINDNASLSYGDKYAKDGVNPQIPKDTLMLSPAYFDNSKGTDIEEPQPLKQENSILEDIANRTPELGDITKLIGNYLGSTAGIKTAAEQRSTDITHTNAFANAGKDAMKYLDESAGAIEGQKAQAISKLTSNTRGGKRGARGSSRGVNQMRATDWLYDTALSQGIADISTNTAAQLAAISGQKAQTSLSVDELKGKGKQVADASNEASKDAYYTALGLGRKDQATGVQQTGKDLNDMSQNDIITNLLQQLGKYVTVDAQGNVLAKNTTK